MMQKVTTPLILFVPGLFLLTLPLKAQKDIAQIKDKPIFHEKMWAARHPFVAKKAYRLTKHTLEVTDSIGRIKKPSFNPEGGMLDAFKHAYWMAALAGNMNWKKAKSLGIAHERSNYRSYIKALKKGVTDEHDQVSMEMDLWNNEKGIAIGLACLGCNTDELIRAVMDSIQTGSLRIIRMNPQGEFLNKDGHVLPREEYFGKWINDKCLVPSND